MAASGVIFGVGNRNRIKRLRVMDADFSKEEKPSSHFPTGLRTTYREPLPAIGRQVISLMRVTAEGEFVRW
jgi:hypothetical protein